jgi:hypothetical protein
MKEQFFKKFSIFLFFFLVLNMGVAMAIQEPGFILESKNNNYEIRQYKPFLVAETMIDSDFEGAGNAAFRILADFIFGNNKSQTKLEMTAPVTQQVVSEKIEMVAPVNQVKKDNGFLVQFVMPEGHTLLTIPMPNDPRVHIKEIPAKRFAVYSYSGSWSESRYNDKLEDFKSKLKNDGIQFTGEPIFSRYNSPFQLWFLRRNEIWFELK